MQIWFGEVVEKLLETKWYVWVIVVALIAMGAGLIFSGRKTRWDSRRLASAAMCVAIAFVLSCVRLFKFPQGGSITALSMLPLILFSVAFGPAQGCLVGCAYGILQLIQDPYVIHPVQLLMDYPLAFGALALGGLVNRMPVSEKLRLPLAVLIGSLGRCTMAVLSGVVFFSANAPAGQAVLIYSIGYNLGYLGPDAILCLIAACLPATRRLVGIMRQGGR